jgi:hypothetical protein
MCEIIKLNWVHIGIKGIKVLDIVLYINVAEASPLNTKSTDHYKKYTLKYLINECNFNLSFRVKA